MSSFRKKPRYQCDKVFGGTRAKSKLPHRPISECMQKGCPHLLERGMPVFGAGKRGHRAAEARRDPGTSTRLVPLELEDRIKIAFGENPVQKKKKKIWKK